jgi:Tfp pilus assembly protein PilW
MALKRARSSWTRGERGVGVVEVLVMSAVMLVVLGIVTQVVVQSNKSYRKQRQLGEARENASATLDMVVRLVRLAQTINPDPDADGVLNSIYLEADWNPANGVLTDPYERIRFWSNGTHLMKQEPTDAAAVAFAERIQSVAFTYFDTNNGALANPMANVSKIAYVTMSAQTTNIDNTPGLMLHSAAAVRRSE